MKTEARPSRRRSRQKRRPRERPGGQPVRLRARTWKLQLSAFRVCRREGDCRGSGFPPRSERREPFRLQHAMAPTPRPAKRIRTEPPNSVQELPATAAAPAKSADHVAVAPAPRDSADSKGKQKLVEPELQDQTEDEDSRTELNLEEMERIYDMLAEDYHDSQSLPSPHFSRRLIWTSPPRRSRGRDAHRVSTDLPPHA